MWKAGKFESRYWYFNYLYGGAEGIRTPDLLLAKQALSRLSYSPNVDYCIKYCLIAKALCY
jgi:hypothetical protein